MSDDPIRQFIIDKIQDYDRETVNGGLVERMRGRHILYDILERYNQHLRETKRLDEEEERSKTIFVFYNNKNDDYVTVRYKDFNLEILEKDALKKAMTEVFNYCDNNHIKNYELKIIGV